MPELENVSNCPHTDTMSIQMSTYFLHNKDENSNYFQQMRSRVVILLQKYAPYSFLGGATSLEENLELMSQI